MKRRKRWWPSAIAVWVALVVVGGLLTLYLQGAEGTAAADPGSPPSDTPSATYEYIPCPSPTENEERTVRACAYKLEN